MFIGETVYDPNMFHNRPVQSTHKVLGRFSFEMAGISTGGKRCHQYFGHSILNVATYKNPNPRFVWAKVDGSGESMLVSPSLVTDALQTSDPPVVPIFREAPGFCIV